MDNRININRASREELMEIDGISDQMADTILKWRDEHGPFNALEELDEIPGIGERRLEQLRESLAFDKGKGRSSSKSFSKSGSSGARKTDSGRSESRENKKDSKEESNGRKGKAKSSETGRSMEQEQRKDNARTGSKSSKSGSKSKGKGASALFSTTSDSSWISSPPSLTTSFATTLPVMVRADSVPREEIMSPISGFPGR